MLATKEIYCNATFVILLSLVNLVYKAMKMLAVTK